LPIRPRLRATFSVSVLIAYDKCRASLHAAACLAPATCRAWQSRPRADAAHWSLP